MLHWTIGSSYNQILCHHLHPTFHPARPARICGGRGFSGTAYGVDGALQGGKQRLKANDCTTQGVHGTTRGYYKQPLATCSRGEGVYQPQNMAR